VRYARYKLAWTVREDSPLKTWRDAVDWAKKNPGQLTFGHPGVASTPVLALGRIAAREGFTFKSIPLGGDAPSISALLGGHVMMIGTSSVSIGGYVQAKRMRVLLVNESEGLEYAPGATSFAQAGYTVANETSLIIFGPKGLPQPVAERLEKAFAEAMRMEPYVSVAKKNEVIVGEALGGRPLADYLARLSAAFEELIKEAGLYKSEKK